MAEPKNLFRWCLQHEEHPLHFWTCARPGRSLGASANVPDTAVETWANNLVRKMGRTHVAIVSLLGQKPNGRSEYAFYTFDSAEEFEEHLNALGDDTQFSVAPCPTTDFSRLEANTIDKVRRVLLELAAKGVPVVVVDSGGAQRTHNLARRLGAKQDMSAAPNLYLAGCDGD